MDSSEIDEILRRTLDDLRLSRGERKAVREVFNDHRERLADAPMVWRSRAFHIAQEVMQTQRTARDTMAVLEWLDEVTKIVVANAVGTNDWATNRIADVIFSPGKACRARIARLLREAKQSADICVFTITDDKLSEPITQAHERGIRVRIVTDDDKAEDRGSDVWRLADAGIEVRVDQSEHHMHHKYAVFDRAIVVTGSYNWTRSAARYNRENVVISDDPRIVSAYNTSFDETWKDLQP